MTIDEDQFEVKKYCVVEWLKKIRESTNRANYIRTQIEKIDAALTLKGVSYSEKVQNGSYADLVPENIDRLHELREELNALISLSIDRFREAFALCCEYENRWAIWLHVVECMTWDEVGRKLYLHPSTAREKADKGYIELYSEMPEEERRYNIPNAMN